MSNALIRILLVEDNEGDQFLIKEALEEIHSEIELVVASTGEEGITKAETIKPHFAILDTNLPGMNGFDTCKKIKESLGESIKVIIMTGVIDAVDAVKARKMGADDYCVKTSDLSQLVNVIKGFINLT